MPKKCIKASQSNLSSCRNMWGGYWKAYNTHREKNYMAVTCSHWCAMHLSNITSLLHIYSRSANTQQQKHHLNILQAHLWQHQADDLERSSHLNWSGCKQKWNKVKSVDEVPFKTKSDNWGNYPSPCQKQKIVSSHVEFSSNTTALIKLT